jgi:hypothetical protein
VNTHSLAVFFMILALGALLDLERPAHNSDATQFYRIGRTALTSETVLEEQSIPGIRALVVSFCQHVISPNALPVLDVSLHVPR